MVNRLGATALAGFFLMIGLSAASLAEPADDHAILLEWIRAEKLISEERAAWQQEKVVLEGMIALLEKEMAQIDDQMAALRRVAEQSAADTKVLTQRERTAETAIDQLKAVLPQVAEYWPVSASELPRPLRENGPFVQGGKNNRSPIRRAMDWLNFYRECADFNRRVTVSPGLRQLRGDQMFQVEEIYFGLAGGFFVTPDGKTGGYLAPAESGTSMVSSGDRRDIAAMAAIAKNHEPPRTIVVPIGVD